VTQALRQAETKQVVDALRRHTITVLDAAEAAEKQGKQGAVENTALFASITDEKLARLAAQLEVPFEEVQSIMRAEVPILLASAGEEKTPTGD